jgi:hypothetical protein
MDGITGALSAAMDPERGAATERQAFWAGMTGPNSGGMSSVSNAMESQLKARLEQDKLRAAYVPLIMQSLVQNRQNDLAYAKFAQDRAEKTTPLINSALYGLQANGKTPTLQEAHQRIKDVGSMFSMSPQELLSHHVALQRGAGDDGSKIGDYLQQLRVAAAPAAEGVPKFGVNASGQTTVQNTIAGTVTEPNTPPGGGVNPTKTSVEVDKMYRQDPGKYTEDLTTSVGAYNDILQRGNAIQANLNEFNPGKYAGRVGGIAAATKDLATRFPNIATKYINDYVTALMGPNGDGKDANPQAAQQFAESLKVQETLAQLKSSLEGAGRIGQTEFRNLNASMLSSVSDPKAFEKFMDYTRGRASNITNKLKAWGEHASTHGDNLSVPAFEIPWQVNEATQLIGNKDQKPAFGQLNVPLGTRNPAVPNPQNPAVVQPRPQPPVQEAPKAPPNIDLSQYEPGTRVGPTGVPYVMENGQPRPARQRQEPKGRTWSGKIIGEN